MMMQSSLVPKTTTNDTSSSKSSSKFDCAKECPCGVPVIPVPEQWLEVMVTGGFKVWHIIFIIIAFIVTIIVVYCCFHRCRIPRTKQEIEADLMRTNITNKFRDYLQEFPNEPTTFIEALKKVQELEEKSEQNDAEYARDAGARKRMGWLKLKGKGGGGGENKPAPAADGETKANGEGGDGDQKQPETEEPNDQPPKGPDQSAEGSREADGVSSRMAITEPTAILVDPKPLQEAITVPKVVEATGGGGGDGGGDSKPKSARRRKQNLSRTKRSKALDIEKPVEEVVIKMSENVRSQLQRHQHRHRVKIDPNPSKEPSSPPPSKLNLSAEERGSRG